MTPIPFQNLLAAASPRCSPPPRWPGFPLRNDRAAGAQQPDRQRQRLERAARHFVQQHLRRVKTHAGRLHRGSCDRRQPFRHRAGLWSAAMQPAGRRDPRRWRRSQGDDDHPDRPSINAHGHVATTRATMAAVCAAQVRPARGGSDVFHCFAFALLTRQSAPRGDGAIGVRGVQWRLCIRAAVPTAPPN